MVSGIMRYTNKFYAKTNPCIVAYTDSGPQIIIRMKFTISVYQTVFSY